LAFAFNCSIRLLAHGGHFDPVDIAVESDAEPSSRSDIRRSEEGIRFCRNQLILCPWWRSAPKVREVMIVVAV